MKRILSIIIVIAVIAGTYYLFTLQGGDKEVTLPEGISTAVVERGPIEALISATGSLAPERIVSVGFSSAGEVAEVLVDAGDSVVSGQTLARLDDTDLQLAVRQAEAAIRASEVQLTIAQKGPSDEELEAARAAIESAKASLADLEAGAGWREKQLAKLAIDQAKNSLWGAQGSRDAIAGNQFADGGQKTQAESQVSNAELAVKMAEIRYEQIFEPPKMSVMASARAQITQAESTLATLLSMPSDESIALAQAQLDQARVNVEIARSRLDDLDLQAPMDGRIVSWDLYLDDIVSPGAPVGTLLDDSRYHIDVSIDETEIAQIALGQEARITVDAFPSVTLEGRVTEIDTLGSNAQGIVTYGISIEVSRTDLDIRPLMTAAVDIVVDRREDVLYVPNRALHRDSDGKYVEIIKAYMPSKVYVEVGVSNEEYTQVLAGLEEGQQVVIAKPRDNVMGGMFGG